MSADKNPTMSKKQLIRSVLIALVVGAIVLVTAVLPAEYNIDPLGAGKLLGFSKLYVGDSVEETIQVGNDQKGQSNFKKLKLEKLGSPPSVDKPIEASNPGPEKQYDEQSDTINVVVLPGKGIEYKFRALKYGSIKYEWATSDNKIVYIDFHGEVFQENPAENVFYESYTLAYSNNMAGTFTAPFEGKHGWYFRNQNKDTVNVTLRLKGQYKLFDK
jgi:hypothetical protein